MMKFISLIAVLAFLSGCSLHSRSGAVVIKPNSSAKSNGGVFCPPGQAKKGKC